MVLYYKKHHVIKKSPAKIYWPSLIVKAMGQNYSHPHAFGIPAREIAPPMAGLSYSLPQAIAIPAREIAPPMAGLSSNNFEKDLNAISKIAIASTKF